MEKSEVRRRHGAQVRVDLRHDFVQDILVRYNMLTEYIISLLSLRLSSRQSLPVSKSAREPTQNPSSRLLPPYPAVFLLAACVAALP